MGGASKRQRDYWWPKVVQIQHGQFCKGCGSIKDLILDKINNDGNHNISDNIPGDFQILCRSCNALKNPRGKVAPIPLKMTKSEDTNKRVEKPLMEWLTIKIENGEQISWEYFVNDGAFLFDVSTDTIEGRYYRKYFKSKSGPFTLYTGDNDRDYIRFKTTQERGTLDRM